MWWNYNILHVLDTHSSCSVAKALHLTPVLWHLGKVKKLVGHFRKPTKATYALLEKQILLNAPQYELVQQCDTRWNSTLYMLQWVREQQPALCAVLLECKDGAATHCLFPVGPEWTLMEELTAVLEPFEEATKAMSGYNYPTVYSQTYLWVCRSWETNRWKSWISSSSSFFSYKTLD